MLEALHDEEWAVREQAASALGKLRDPRAVDPLVAALKDKYLGRADGKVVSEEVRSQLSELGAA
jgi:HEAT repeat protein